MCIRDRPTVADVFPTAAIEIWQADVSSGVPGGTGAVVLVSGTSFKITITYPQQALVNENKAAESEDVTYVLFASL